MNDFMLAALVSLVPIGLALLFLYHILVLRLDSEVLPDVSLALSPEKYRPMERLLRKDDFEYLAQRPGVSWRVRYQLRRQRRHIFRGYLRSMRSDFRRVFVVCEALVVHSAEGRGDLAARVIRLRLNFALGMLAVEARLLLHAAGVGMVDVRPFVESLQAVQAQARFILAAPQMAESAA